MVAVNLASFLGLPYRRQSTNPPNRGASPLPMLTNRSHHRRHAIASKLRPIPVDDRSANLGVEARRGGDDVNLVANFIGHRVSAHSEPLLAGFEVANQRGIGKTIRVDGRREAICGNDPTWRQKGEPDCVSMDQYVLTHMGWAPVGRDARPAHIEVTPPGQGGDGATPDVVALAEHYGQAVVRHLGWGRAQQTWWLQQCGPGQLPPQASQSGIGDTTRPHRSHGDWAIREAPVLRQCQATMTANASPAVAAVSHHIAV